MKAAVVTGIGKLIKEEVRVMYANKSDSILRCIDPVTLRNFKCDSVVSEMESYAMLLEILKEATKLNPPKLIRKNQVSKQSSQEYANKQNAIITMTTAIIADLLCAISEDYFIDIAGWLNPKNRCEAFTS